jgi:hypothetical protein
MTTSKKEVKIPVWPHMRVVQSSKNRLIITLSWSKNREVCLVGDRLSKIVSGRIPTYILYVGDRGPNERDVASWQTNDIEIVKMAHDKPWSEKMTLWVETAKKEGVQ